MINYINFLNKDVKNTAIKQQSRSDNVKKYSLSQPKNDFNNNKVDH